jgi:hypothetical protein
MHHLFIPLRLGSVIPLKYPKFEKNELFYPPFFYERIVMYVMVIDDLYNISFSYSVCFDLSTFLVQKKKKHDF